MLLISCDCIVSLKFVQSNDLFTKRANCGIFFCIKETSSSGLTNLERTRTQDKHFL